MYLASIGRTQELAALANDVRQRVIDRLFAVSTDVSPKRLAGIVSSLHQVGRGERAAELFRAVLLTLPAKLDAMTPLDALESLVILHGGLPRSLSDTLGDDTTVTALRRARDVASEIGGEDLARAARAASRLIVKEARRNEVEALAKSTMERAVVLASELKASQIADVFLLVQKMAAWSEEIRGQGVKLVKSVAPHAMKRAEEFHASDVAGILNPLGQLPLDEDAYRQVVDVVKAVLPKAHEAALPEAALILNRVGKLPLDQEARAAGAAFLRAVLPRLKLGALDIFLLSGVVNAVGRLAQEEEIRDAARPLMEKALAIATSRWRSFWGASMRTTLKGFAVFGWPWDERMAKLVDAWGPGFGGVQGEAAADIVAALSFWGQPIPERLSAAARTTASDSIHG